MERRGPGSRGPPSVRRRLLGGRIVAEWASFTAVISGLLATLLLAGSIHLARKDEESARDWTITVMAAAGLAASALFGGLLILQLIIELIRAVSLATV